mmetsp:Transcript_2940/g.7027  ORF Transcript_2940/g.7027 Transcript_2940/m.7027 type:complete len:188 (-) Transcript_2940:166-729(-)|eukprot:CAMPEP_0114140636 /NCGR_PEP_ID=MMETSP0043_2-20121206/17489_1 /TAXON_ID=464988 /ORGANISM="Hemiselmis andersenii, Strain CCMP644" /LENGTH=187 /DNA_ID=CAMNT_0001234741 /DNA_START=43 /DNA_END=606 /DNA_ORIENTATION=-
MKYTPGRWASVGKERDQGMGESQLSSEDGWKPIPPTPHPTGSNNKRARLIQAHSTTGGISLHNRRDEYQTPHLHLRKKARGVVILEKMRGIEGRYKGMLPTNKIAGANQEVQAPSFFLCDEEQDPDMPSESVPSDWPWQDCGSSPSPSPESDPQTQEILIVQPERSPSPATPDGPSDGDDLGLDHEG